jgi:NAD(P)H dehydrogenase (quinone)
MKIIVTGSLGNISKPIISSNPEKKKEIESLNAKAAIGSLSDVNFLTETFTGADALYGMIPFDYKEQDQTTYFNTIADAYVQAIKATGINKLVLLSGWAADIVKSPDVGSMLAQLSGVNVTELRPGSFYTNFYGYIGMIKESGVIMSNYGGDDKVAFVSPKDIATAAYEELTNPLEGKKVRYVASEELTCNEAAAILGNAISKPDLKWITITEEQIRNAFLNMGIPAQLANNLVAMQAATHSGAVYENYLRHRPILGQTKLKDFAKEFAAAYQQQ